MTATARSLHWNHAGSERFDVAILGGGVTGCSLYDALCRRGYRALLVDPHDFASHTSQASGMMIWGGLLYLRQFDFPAVVRLCLSRDRMLRELGHLARPCPFRYIPSRRGGPSRLLVAAGLAAYWLLGGARRRVPAYQTRFVERSLLAPGVHRSAFRFDEGVLKDSDARFVLSWVTPHAPPYGSALNHCAVLGGEFDPSRKSWRLALRDRLIGAECAAEARIVVNCAGPWVDALNKQFGVESPLKHVFSKGVYIGLQRSEAHEAPLIFDMGEHADVLTYVPWGPIALWGPTETSVEELDGGLHPTTEDVRFLLKHASRHLRKPVGAGDIVSLRCGVRALAVDRSYSSSRYPLELSRGGAAHADPQRPWISVFGGKITDCRERAAKVARVIEQRIGAGKMPSSRADGSSTKPDVCRFPGIEEPIASPQWCKEREFCHRLEDYLRRRTNIAQWTPRRGLGRRDENLETILSLAKQFEDTSGETSRAAAQRYQAAVAERFDEVLRQV